MYESTYESTIERLREAIKTSGIFVKIKALNEAIEVIERLVEENNRLNRENFWLSGDNRNV